MKISVRRIQEAIAADFGIPSHMFLTVQETPVCYPRQYAMLLAREMTGKSYPDLGGLFRRDHATIMHGIKKAKARVEKDADLALKLGARKLLLECEPQPDPLSNVLRHISEPAARKAVIMSKWQRGEIGAERASKLIRHGGLVNA